MNLLKPTLYLVLVLSTLVGCYKQEKKIVPILKLGNSLSRKKLMSKKTNHNFRRTDKFQIETYGKNGYGFCSLGKRLLNLC
jgi:hypothetical protein